MAAWSKVLGEDLKDSARRFTVATTGSRRPGAHDAGDQPHEAGDCALRRQRRGFGAQPAPRDRHATGQADIGTFGNKIDRPQTCRRSAPPSTSAAIRAMNEATRQWRKQPDRSQIPNHRKMLHRLSTPPPT